MGNYLALNKIMMIITTVHFHVLLSVFFLLFFDSFTKALAYHTPLFFYPYPIWG